MKPNITQGSGGTLQLKQPLTTSVKMHFDFQYHKIQKMGRGRFIQGIATPTFQLSTQANVANYLLPHTE